MYPISIQDNFITEMMQVSMFNVSNIKRDNDKLEGWGEWMKKMTEVRDVYIKDQVGRRTDYGNEVSLTPFSHLPHHPIYEQVL